jgi:ABC-type dipeptide/oligopeptide/nickel transport system permease component
MRAQFVLRRLVTSFLTVIAVMVVVFFIARLRGDPTALLVGDNASVEQIEQLRHKLGYDRPIYVQFIDFLGHAARGDLGDSLWQHQPAFKLVMDRLPATASLGLIALGLALLVAVPSGVIAAVRRGTIIDRLIMSGALLGQSLPTFWIGIVVILVFSVRLHWLPASGTGSWTHYILPAITLASFSIARVARLVRSSMLDVLHRDYIRTARAKGLSDQRVIGGHALRNALIPVVTIIGIEAGQLLSGAIITETIFAWPGLGQLMIQAISNRDFPLLQAAAAVVATIFVATNLIVDLAYMFLDPRIRYG